MGRQQKLSCGHLRAIAAAAAQSNATATSSHESSAIRDSMRQGRVNRPAIHRSPRQQQQQQKDCHQDIAKSRTEEKPSRLLLSTSPPGVSWPVLSSHRLHGLVLDEEVLQPRLTRLPLLLRRLDPGHRIVTLLSYTTADRTHIIPYSIDRTGHQGQGPSSNHP